MAPHRLVPPPPPRWASQNWPSLSLHCLPFLYGYIVLCIQVHIECLAQQDTSLILSLKATLYLRIPQRAAVNFSGRKETHGWVQSFL